MPPAKSAAARGSTSEPQHRPAQTRVINAALELFAEHGVGGTSLQMIADALGVTKAAIYYQFKTKEEIVIAVAGAELSRVEEVLDLAEAEPTRQRARQVLVDHMIDLAVEHRRLESTLLGDPVIVRHFAQHKPFREVTERLYSLLMGEETGSDAYLQAAMLTAAIGGAAMHPMVMDFDDEALRAGLQRLTRRFLET